MSQEVINGRKDAWTLFRELEESPAVTLNWKAGDPVILIVDSEKGGVGKTAVTIGLATAAADQGLKVLVIDLDPRATATDETGVAGEDLDVTPPEFTVNDIMYVDPEDQEPPDLRGAAADAIVPAGQGWPANVHVLAGDRALGNRESDISPGLEDRLKLSLEGVADGYDLVVIDLPPRAGGRIVAAAVKAATHVLYPATLDTDGYIGVKDAKISIRKMRNINSSIKEVGVLRNIVAKSRTTLAAQYDDRLRTQYADTLLDMVVPKYVIRQESRSLSIPLTAAKGSREADLILAAYTQVLNAIGEAR